MFNGKITRDKEESEIYLDLLQQHFDSVETYDKYPDASLNRLITTVCEKILGKSFSKKRISKRKEKKIKNTLEQKIKSLYGNWVTFTNFKIKKDLALSYITNLHRVFRVKDLGILYGCHYHYITGNIFLTSHAIKRFEERVDATYLYPMYKFLMNEIHTEPTGYDLLSHLIELSNYEYGRKDKYCYLNTVLGYIVLEDLGDVLIAKTFYANDMVKQGIKWYQADVDVDNVNSFVDVLNSPAKPIKEPTFLQDDVSKYIDKSSMEDLLKLVKNNL